MRCGNEEETVIHAVKGCCWATKHVNANEEWESKWKPPENYFSKINFDGAVDTKKKHGRIGELIRDYEGKVLGAYCDKLSGVTNPFTAKDYATIRTSKFAKDMEIHDIILEGDSLMVIKQMKNWNWDLSLIGNLIKAEFNEYSVQHIKREGNAAIHKLAKDGFSITERKY
ncbi:uncharacterized protein LOC111290172 [Durio zibethinus]|uniref:Uncharacterized protein LOC111290172 n=1 Tax=Durio zibethinus TaxID=66656 RepID=A0A6P5Y9Y5_DURZI|nr:uncharacterized protein LOC111290172 [Durio zibethinus]